MKVFIALLCCAAGGLAVPTLKEPFTNSDVVQGLFYDWIDDIVKVWNETKTTAKDVERIMVTNPKWKQLTGRVQEEVCTRHEFIGHKITCVKCVRAFITDIIKCFKPTDVMCIIAAVTDFIKCTKQ